MTDALWQRQKAYLDGITGDEVLRIESLLREQSPLVNDTLPQTDQDLIKRYMERDLIYRLENPINACLVDIATMELAAREIIRLRGELDAARRSADRRER